MLGSKNKFTGSRFCSLALSLLAACGGDPAIVTPVVEPPPRDCLRPIEPTSYQIYFVLDVSGSMGPFLRDLRSELIAFADGFPPLTSEDRPVSVEYHVIAFVNDVKQYGGRMTSHIALEAAFDEAITAGATNYNLNTHTFNAEPEENTLDALAKVIELDPSKEARLVIVAGDAPFVEAPGLLQPNIVVQSTYESILEAYREREIRVHAFTETDLDGITRGYRGQPALTSLPGSSHHSLRALTGARDQIRDTLVVIAHDAACN